MLAVSAQHSRFPARQHVEIGSTAAIPTENPTISPPPKPFNTTVSELKAFLGSKKAGFTHPLTPPASTGLEPERSTLRLVFKHAYATPYPRHQLAHLHGNSFTS
jgi:hypothetical protein